MPFDTAVEKSIEGMKQEGFCVLIDVDVEVTLKAKINLDKRPDRILAACNSALPSRALEAEKLTLACCYPAM
jgi:uncharacterized protein (DUF302 family)